MATSPRPLCFLLLLIGCSISAGCRKEPVRRSAEQPAANDPASQQSRLIEFDDVTASSNVDVVYQNGEEAGELSIVETLGGGVAILDYDCDGRHDLLFPTGGRLSTGKPLPGRPNKLYRNRGEFRFVEVSSPASVGEARTYSHGCAAADADGDGFTDIVVTGYEGLQFFRNRGDGTYVDWTDEAGLNDELWSSSAGWGDFDGDGLLDLYVTHYVDWSWDHHPRCPSRGPGSFDVCAPSEFEPLPDTIYLNRGDGTFSAVRQEVGLRGDGKGLGVIVADLNLDSSVDLYVANDTTNNFLYINDGHGRFTESALVRGVAVDGNGNPNGSMGIAVFDLENDLQPDLWVTNYENETSALYRNTGDGMFLWATESAGVNALGTLFVGFGVTAGDFDLDGAEDIAVANGHLLMAPQQATLAQEPLLLRNTMRRGSAPRLVRQAFPENSYFATAWRGRGVVKGDLDGNGSLDLVFTNVNQRAAVLSNITETQGRALALRLVGTSSNRDAIGAYAILETDAGKYARFVVGGGSYLSQAPYILTWAIPEGETFKRILIRWPDGQRQEIGSRPAQYPSVVIQEGRT